jgi:hypothetical protein
MKGIILETSCHLIKNVFTEGFTRNTDSKIELNIDFLLPINFSK